ncbi:hypothetical protein B0H13DRAFT_2339538 [Mycena leptocephala]|nr:hypothetical protein B0H13DRAFT_2339538 [Mycena leptocephala]
MSAGTVPSPHTQIDGNAVRARAFDSVVLLSIPLRKCEWEQNPWRLPLRPAELGSLPSVDVYNWMDRWIGWGVSSVPCGMGAAAGVSLLVPTHPFFFHTLCLSYHFSSLFLPPPALPLPSPSRSPFAQRPRPHCPERKGAIGLGAIEADAGFPSILSRLNLLPLTKPHSKSHFDMLDFDCSLPAAISFPMLGHYFSGHDGARDFGYTDARGFIEEGLIYAPSAAVSAGGL